jgi:hypothetical protein
MADLTDKASYRINLIALGAALRLLETHGIPEDLVYSAAMDTYQSNPTGDMDVLIGQTALRLVPATEVC